MVGADGVWLSEEGGKVSLGGADELAVVAVVCVAAEVELGRCVVLGGGNEKELKSGGSGGTMQVLVKVM